uniref:Uncharacterized protein n=1 Tax=Solanum lycopersicum TaxID=4081 RepID=A0A3Q7EQK6_SOLLC
MISHRCLHSKEQSVLSITSGTFTACPCLAAALSGGITILYSDISCDTTSCDPAGILPRLRAELPKTLHGRSEFKSPVLENIPFSLVTLSSLGSITISRMLVQVIISIDLVRADGYRIKKLKDNEGKYYQRKRTRDDETYKLLYPMYLQFFFSSFSSQHYLLNYYKRMKVTLNQNLPMEHFQFEASSGGSHPAFVSHTSDFETEADEVSIQSTCIAA